MITECDAAKHLKYLISTDEEAGRLKALVDALDGKRKIVRAVEFLKVEGSAAVREQMALSSKSYVEHMSKLESAQYDYEIIKAKRLTSVTAIEMWRSVNSNQRKGNI
jgi:hypothetical protein